MKEDDGMQVLEEEAYKVAIKNIDDQYVKAIILAEEVLSQMEDLDDYVPGEGKEQSMATKMLGEIYDLLHGVNEYNMCYHVHDKMRERLEGNWKAYIKERDN